MQRLFRQLPETKLLRRKGVRVKLGRWSSWLNAHRDFRGEGAVLLLLLVYMGTCKGWWKSVEQLPAFSARSAMLELTPDEVEATERSGLLHEVDAVPAAPASSSSSSSGAAPPAASGQRGSAAAGSGDARPSPQPAHPRAAISTMTTKKGGEVVPTSVRDSNAALRGMRKRCQNTLHFCAQVLFNFYGSRTADVIEVGLRQFSSFFDRGKTVCKTRSGALDFHKHLVDWGMTDVVGRAMQDLENPENMHLIGFADVAEADFLPEGCLFEEECLATALFNLVVATSKSFIMSAMTYSSSYPGRFLALVDIHSAERRAEILSDLKNDFDLLNSLERLACTDQWFRNVLEQLRWPLEQYTREVWVMLFEEGFNGVTGELQNKLDGFAHSWMSTNINEDLFNRFRNKESAHSAGQFGDLSKWHTASTTNLLQEYDRQEIKGNGSAVQGQAPPAAKNSVFHPSKKKFSLPAETLKGFDDPTAFPHLSPAALKLRGVLWEAARVLKDNLVDLKRVWLSLLVSGGSLVYNPHVPHERRGGSCVNGRLVQNRFQTYCVHLE